MKIHPVRFKHLRFSFVRNVVHSANFKLRLNGKFRTRRITPHHASKTFNQATSQETVKSVEDKMDRARPSRVERSSLHDLRSDWIPAFLRGNDDVETCIRRNNNAIFAGMTM